MVFNESGSFPIGLDQGFFSRKKSTLVIGSVAIVSVNMVNQRSFVALELCKEFLLL